MAEFNINNLELDDNSFDVLPDGDYYFTVESFELGYATSEKIPPNTQQVVCHLEIPYEKDGEICTAKVINNLNLYKKAMFAVRQYAECIGLSPEKGKQNVDLTKMVGRTGVCSLSSYENAKGNEYNRVELFYSPSKVPAVRANDDAWKKMHDFEVTDDDGLPFDI